MSARTCAGTHAALPLAVHRILILVVVAACAAEDNTGEPMPAATLGGGDLWRLTWDGGPCPRDYECAGELELIGDVLIATFADDTLAARGRLTQATVDELAALVAAIPASDPTGVMDQNTDGPGYYAMWIRLDEEIRVYVSNGFYPGIGARLYDLRAAIAQCANGTLVASFTSCTPQP